MTEPEPLIMQPPFPSKNRASYMNHSSWWAARRAPNSESNSVWDGEISQFKLLFASRHSAFVAELFNLYCSKLG